MEHTHKLRAAVIGVGYLGNFHAQKYAGLADVELVGVADIDPARAEEVGRRLGVPGHVDYRRLLGQVDLASIAVPTESHYEVAQACLEAGIHILVEKPVTQTVAQAQALIELAQAHRLVFQVGHVERFNPAVLALHGMLERPMFIESHRLAVFKPRSIDVDVVLDLMIHDIDVILSLVPGRITEIRASGTPVLTDAVDIANARLEFESGCVANVTASRVSQKSMRKLRVFQPDCYVVVDYGEHRISIRRKHGEQTDAGGFAKITAQEEKFGDSDPLLAQIRAFVDAVRHGTPPLVSGAEGKRALEVALEIVRDIKGGGR